MINHYAGIFSINFNVIARRSSVFIKKLVKRCKNLHKEKT